jgi:hypothetical protein
VQRAAHQRRPHHRAIVEGLLETLGFEVGQPRPQPDVRVLRLLSLHPGEALDRLGRLEVVPFEQQLPRQHGPVDRALRHRHAPTVLAR